MTTYLTPVNEIEKKWHHVNAEAMILGRLATEIAIRLRGKHKPSFSTFIDNGDFVVVTNADKIRLTGRKWDQKKYYHHTGYIGNLKETTAKELIEKHPTDVLYRAVRGMLPKNTLGRQQLKKLKLFAGPEHTHAAQMPVDLDIKQK